VRDSEFRRCKPTTGSGGAILASDYNGGIQVARCWFEGNSTQLGGGAVSIGGTGTNVVSDCVFWNNRTTGLAASPGALFLGFGATVTGNTFYANAGGHPQVAGTIRCDIGMFQIWSNIIASTTKGVAVQGVNAAVITGGCNVFWDNPDGEAIGYTLAASDRIIDPQFCGADSGNFDVAKSSPCLPAHSGGCNQIGARGQGCGPISVDARSWGEIKAAYRREPEGGAKP
jgi:hypothetical protein